MKVTIDNQEYRLYFRYKWERPINPGSITGRVDLRRAEWHEVSPLPGDTKGRMGEGIYAGQFWRTTEAILAKVLPSQADGARSQYEEVAKGVVRCSPVDYRKRKGHPEDRGYDKEFGRRESLRRLQEELRGKGFTGAQLGEVYAAYANRALSAEDFVNGKGFVPTEESLAKTDPAAAQLRKELGI